MGPIEHQHPNWANEILPINQSTFSGNKSCIKSLSLTWSCYCNSLWSAGVFNINILFEYYYCLKMNYYEFLPKKLFLFSAKNGYQQKLKFCSEHHKQTNIFCWPSKRIATQSPMGWVFGGDLPGHVLLFVWRYVKINPRNFSYLKNKYFYFKRSKKLFLFIWV